MLDLIILLHLVEVKLNRVNIATANNKNDKIIQ